MRCFFSNTTSLNSSISVKSNKFLPALPVLTQQTSLAHDSLFISDIGKKLSLSVSRAYSPIETQKTEQTSPLSPEAKQADKAMAKVIDILGRMQKLAIAAQDKQLSDSDRVEMQIEIEDLRTNLKAVPWNLRGGKGRPPILPKPVEWGDYGYGDYSSVLGRMRERVSKGQAWDVREAWCPESFTRVTHDDNGNEVLETVEANAWHVVDDKNVSTYREGKNADSGKSVSTVREILEWASPVVVMDTKSADKGARFLEQQIASIKKWREQLPSNLENFSMENSIAFLEKIAFPSGHYNDSLTDPTDAGKFLFSDGIYDYRYVTRNLEENSADSMSLTDGEILKNYLIASGHVNKNESIKIYWYSGPKLRTEGDETTVSQNGGGKIIYAKGGALYYAY